MLLDIKNVYKSYRQPGGGLFSGRRKTVLEDISLTISAGEVLALVGESGSGKSTLARLVLGLEKADSGRILLAGRPVADRLARRKHLSAVFQNYSSSINPYYTVLEAITEPLLLAGRPKAAQEAKSLMERVALDQSLIKRRPHELSGGQAQRVCLARAIATSPSLIIMDEPLSSLDVSAQVGILELLLKLKEELKLAYLFITHDLQAVAWLCGRVAFLKAGRVLAESAISEIAYTEEPYARNLLASALAS